MRGSNHKNTVSLLSAFAILTMLLAACGPIDLAGASGGGGSDCSHENTDGDSDFCQEGGGQSGSWSSPADTEIYSFVIKAGNADYGAVDGCYEVNQSSTFVSWNRVGDGPDCKEISHVEIYYRTTAAPPPPVVPPTNTPTEPPVEDPTDEPTDEPTEEPTEPPTVSETVTLCHATGDPYPYQRVTVVVDPVTGKTGHEDHVNDIIPVPATGCPESPEPVAITICHATGSDTTPYVEMTVPIDAATGTHGHEGHGDDIIPAPADGCPKPTKSETITLCHATGDAALPYVEMTVPVDSVTGMNGHEGHADDISPVPAEGCPQPAEPPEPPDVPAVEAPEPGTCPEYIIFHSFREENLEIYRLDGVEGAADYELINLTQSDAVDCRPSRSPNDAWVVYQSDRNGNVELYYTDLGGSNQTRLTDTESNNINPMFGPNNASVAYQSDRNGNWDIFVVGSDTYEESQLTSSLGDDVNPYWSSDMRWMVFQSDRNGTWDIYLLDTQTGNEYALIATGANEVFPTWSPNGKQVAYLSDSDGAWNLFVIDVDGQNNTQITFGAGDVGNVSWSPEGMRLAYQSQRGSNLDVYSYDLNTGAEYRLTDYAGQDSSPTWNCGGSQIAFTSIRDGNPNILQVPWQGGSQSNLTIDPATDKWSEWSPAKEFGSRGE